MPQIFIEKVNPAVKAPTRATSRSVGIDLYLPEPLIISRHNQKSIPLGIKVVLPKGHFGWIVARSSIVLRGMTIEAGIIDEDYRGELRAIVRNGGTSALYFERGAKIAQLLVLRYTPLEITLVPTIRNVVNDELNERGEGGFGSSDAAIRV